MSNPRRKWKQGDIVSHFGKVMHVHRTYYDGYVSLCEHSISNTKWNSEYILANGCMVYPLTEKQKNAL